MRTATVTVTVKNAVRSDIVNESERSALAPVAKRKSRMPKPTRSGCQSGSTRGHPTVLGVPPPASLKDGDPQDACNHPFPRNPTRVHSPTCLVQPVSSLVVISAATAVPLMMMHMRMVHITLILSSTKPLRIADLHSRRPTDCRSTPMVYWPR